MAKKINIKNFLLCLILYVSILGELLLYWLTGKSFVYIVPFGIIVLIIMDSKKIKIDKTGLTIFALLLLLIAINLFIPVKREYFSDAVIRGTFAPLFTGLLILRLKDYKNTEKTFFKPMFVILNIYCIINFFIMLKQISTPGFMVHNRSGNTYYVDMIAGLVGENGTHKLTFIFIFCLYLNMYFFDNEKKYMRIMSRIFFVIVLLSSLYISAFNDNRMYYFILIIALLPIIINKLKKIKIKKDEVIKKFVTLLCAVIAIISIYKTNTNFRKFVDESIIENYYNRTFNKLNNSKEDTGKNGEERMELFKYAISHTNLLIGKGIGSIHMVKEPSLPKHFGMNDIIVRVYTGGVFFPILIMLLYINFYRQLFGRNDKMMTIFVTIFTILCAFYTQSYSQINKTFLISLALFMIYSVYNKKKES